MPSMPSLRLGLRFLGRCPSLGLLSHRPPSLSWGQSCDRGVVLRNSSPAFSSGGRRPSESDGLSLQAESLFTAQMLSGATAPHLRRALEELEEELTDEVQERVGEILVKMMKACSSLAVSHGGAGTLGLVADAIKQSKIAQLLEALGHPSAHILGQEHPPLPDIVKISLADQHQDGAGKPSGTQPGPSQPAESRKRGKKRPASPPPNRKTANHANQAVSSEPQHPRPQAPLAANYGHEEQAEAKRQAKKEAALAWLDKARTASHAKNYSVAVNKFFFRLVSKFF